MNVTLLGVVYAGAFSLVGGIVTAISLFMIGKRKSVVDDRIDMSHTQQAAYDGIRAELKDYKESAYREFKELKDSSALAIQNLTTRADSLQDKWVVQANELIETKAKLADAELKLKEQQLQIIAIKDQSLKQRQDNEAIIIKLHDENNSLLSNIASLEASNRDQASLIAILTDKVGKLTVQVHGNTAELQDMNAIGKMETRQK